MLGRPRPTTPLPIQRPPSSGAFTPAHCVPVFPAGQPTPGLARPSCLVCPAVPAIRLPGGCTGTPVMKVRLRRYLPRQRSGQVPLPVGSAPHNPDHSRQRVGISQPGADGPATTPGLDSSHGPSIAYPSPTQTKTEISHPQLNKSPPHCMSPLCNRHRREIGRTKYGLSTPGGGAFRSPCHRSDEAGAESKGLNSGMGEVSSPPLPLPPSSRGSTRDLGGGVLYPLSLDGKVLG